jgi:hypothetical protein
MEISETLSRNIQELWEKHCKLISYYPFSRNKWIVVKECLKKKKLETRITTREMIKYKTRRQCKPNNARNEHDTNGLL